MQTYKQIPARFFLGDKPLSIHSAWPENIAKDTKSRRQPSQSVLYGTRELGYRAPKALRKTGLAAKIEKMREAIFFQRQARNRVKKFLAA